jgi:hypothetical protein
MSSSTKPWRCVALAAFVAASALLAYRASATQYDVVVLDQQAGIAHAVAQGNVAGGDHTGLPTVWSNNGATVTHLPLPPGSSGATLLAISGNQIGGYGGTGTDTHLHALLWNGTNSQPVDFGAFSGIYGIYNGIQVGDYSPDHAALWRGTAASLVDLSPPGATFFTEASSIWGNEVSGTWHRDPTGSDPHAAVWTSLSPSGFVDLSLPSFLKSDAPGISRGQVAGWAIIVNAGKHAGIWTNNAASFQDLAPAGTTASELFGTNGVQQVGDVALLPGGSTDAHAAVWTGTAASYQMLPPAPGRNFSRAFGIDGNGDIVGEAGQQVAGSIGNFEPVMWVPHRLPGDANFDGIVNFSDLLILSQHYGQTGEWVDGEFSGGGTVDFADLLTLAQNYGKTQAAVEYSMEAAVPEPAPLALLAPAAILLRRRRN